MINDFFKRSVLISTSLYSKQKHYYLTRYGLKFSNSSETETLPHYILNHDVIVGKVLKSLNELPQFYDGRVYLESKQCSIDPDIMIRGVRHKKFYNLAIEVELTQKSKSRVKNKLIKYMESGEFDYILYISNKPFILKTYLRFLNELDESFHKKIILMYCEGLTPTKFNPLESRLFYKGKDRTFEEVFGSEKDVSIFPMKFQSNLINSKPAGNANSSPIL